MSNPKTMAQVEQFLDNESKKHGVVSYSPLPETKQHFKGKGYLITSICIVTCRNDCWWGREIKTIPRRNGET